MTVHKWSEVKCARLEPEQIQAVAQQAQSELDRLEMNLSELREKNRADLGTTSSRFGYKPIPNFTDGISRGSLAFDITPLRPSAWRRD